ncbi:MAG: tyrosine-type recombinase/integrase [Sphingobacteriales bacterium]|jgi:site-specific recombinase XerD|nr:tyrosine-type recombinase/integrase [Sphingobacteriales bacterium]
MKKIRKKVGIDKSVTTYVARHAFSTVMKRSGASTEFIREALGWWHLMSSACRNEYKNKHYLKQKQ